MRTKKVIAIIPARGNSKRIPNKNCKNFNGKPIICRTIKLLKKSKLFDRIIVSSDNKKICSISQKYGAEVPFIRPRHLSGDYTGTAEVIAHCVKFLIEKNYSFDYVCCVYAPNPFLRVSDLKKGLVKLKSKKYSYVFSATQYQYPIFRSFIYHNKKNIKMLFPKSFFVRSQDLDEIFCDAGQFYWAHKKTWLTEKKFFSKKSNFVIIPKWRYHDIDTVDDWRRAEIFHRYIT